MSFIYPVIHPSSIMVYNSLYFDRINDDYSIDKILKSNMCYILYRNTNIVEFYQLKQFIKLLRLKNYEILM